MAKILSLSLILYLLFADTLYSQNSLIARYNITDPISLAGESGKQIQVRLEYEGRIFSKGNKALLYMRPLFLNQYPDGVITYTYPSGITYYHFSKDSMFLPELYNKDSLKRWSCFNDDRNSKLNEYIIYRYRIDSNSLKDWIILPETKVINGFICRHAQSYYSLNGTRNIFWDIWYYPDIPFSFFFGGLHNCPGLIIKADNLQGNMHYDLKSIENNTNILEDTFTPPIFKNAVFKDLNKMRAETQTEKQIKQSKIMDQ